MKGAMLAVALPTVLPMPLMVRIKKEYIFLTRLYQYDFDNVFDL
jgi:hypothetical protein